MDSLPSLPSMSYSLDQVPSPVPIPKRRLARPSSTTHSHPSETGSGTAVVSRFGDSRLPDPLLFSEPPVSLSTSEGELDPEQHPGLLLRSILARTESNTRPDARSVQPTTRKAFSAPSVHDSDLDSISVFSANSNGKASASNHLASVFSRAMKPPPISPRRARSRSPGRGRDRQPRSSHSDDELFSHSTMSMGAASQAESFERLRIDLERQMKASASEHALSNKSLSDISDDDPLKSADAIFSTPPRPSAPPSSLKNYINNALSKTKLVTDESDDQITQDEISRPPTPKQSGIRRNLGPSTILEPFETLQSSPEKPRTAQPFPPARPKFHGTNAPRRDLEVTRSVPSISGSTKDSSRSTTLSPERLSSRQRTLSAPQRPRSPLIRSRTPINNPEQDLHERERSWGKHHVNPTLPRTHSHSGHNSALSKKPSSESLSSSPEHQEHESERVWGRHPSKLSSPGQSPTPNGTKATGPSHSREESENTVSRERDWGKQRPRPNTPLSRPSSAHGAISTPYSDNGQDEEVVHVRERNWNSPRPDWTHRTSYTQQQSSRGVVIGGGRSDDDDTEKETPNSRAKQPAAVPLERRTLQPGIVVSASHQSDTSSIGPEASDYPPNSRSVNGLPQTPKVPGYWNTTVLGGLPGQNGMQMPSQDDSSLKQPLLAVTPAPPGGWTATPGLKKGILKVRFDGSKDGEDAIKDEEDAEHESMMDRGQERSVTPSVEQNPSAAQVPSISPSKSVLRVVDALGKEVPQTPSPPHPHPVSSSNRLPATLQVRQPLLTRIKEKLADIRSALPNSPNTSVLSASADGSGTDDEQSRKTVMEASLALGALNKRMQILKSEEEEHSYKLAKLRESFHSAEVTNLPSLPIPAKHTHLLANLRFALLFEVLFAMFILWTLRSRAQSLYITNYYDPHFPALYADPEPQGFRLAAAAVGINADWSNVHQNWWQVPQLMWHLVIHRFWEWWTRGGWNSWSDRSINAWVPT